MDLEQLDLKFPVGKATGHAPWTSFNAANVNRKNQRLRVLAYYAACGKHGATDDEICEVLNLSSNAVRPRRNELMESKYVTLTTEKRLTRSGFPAGVYAITIKGNAANMEAGLKR